MAVIAEVKRRSPSKGPLAPDLDPVDVATAYAAGGAACLSVLTDRDYFGGSPTDLLAARSAAGLPVLRKDFTVTVADVDDARLMGADAVLLIVAALERRASCADFAAAAAEVGLDALVEVHDEPELDRALAAGATLVGVNQRDLATFAVDGERAERLVAAIPADVVAVAESGIGGPEDAARLAGAGYQAVLVGETLVRAGRPGGRGRRAGRASGGPTGRRRAMRFVKICGITSEADALLAVGLGADALGFIFAPSPRQISPAAVGDIVKRLPARRPDRRRLPRRRAETGRRDRQPDRPRRGPAARPRDRRGHPVGARAGVVHDQGVPGRRPDDRPVRRVRRRLSC